MEYDNKTINWMLIGPLNHQLNEIFDLIDYQSRFRLKLSSHAIDRMKERISKDEAARLGKMLKRIISYGVCELLYYHTRHANGEVLSLMEFVDGDLVIPITFVADIVVLRTILYEGEQRNNENRIRIDLSDSKFNLKVVP